MNDNDGINDYFISNFQELCTSTNPQIPQDLENLIPSLISDQENNSLIKIPDVDEIKAILFSMSDLKAPGPHGMLTLLFKKYLGHSE